MSPYVLKKIEGLALITVLLFMQIFTVLGLYLIQNTLLLKSRSHDLLTQKVLFNLGENYLKQIQNEFQIASCFISTINQNDLRQASLQWWQTKACTKTISEVNYYYVIENLGDDPCVVIKDKKSSWHYFRISALIQDKKTQARTLLQMTYAQLAEPTHACEASSHTMSEGLQMWRELR